MIRSRLKARILFLAIVSSLAVAGCSVAYGQSVRQTAKEYGISQGSLLDWGDADTQSWLDRLNEIELILQHEDISEATLNEALSDADRIGRAAMIRHREEVARLKPIEKELTSLGPVPEDGGAPEPPDIEKLRAEVNQRIAKKESLVRAIQLVIARADNLEAAS